jgi:hypothetical protein
MEKGLRKKPEGVGDEVPNKKGCNNTAFFLFSIQ